LCQSNADIDGEKIIKGIPLVINTENTTKTNYIASYINEQLQSENDFADNYEIAFTNLCRYGTYIIKTFWDPKLKKIVNRAVSPENFVINYFTNTKIEEATRYHQIIWKTADELKRDNQKDYILILKIYQKKIMLILMMLNWQQRKDLGNHYQPQIVINLEK